MVKKGWRSWWSDKGYGSKSFHHFFWIFLLIQMELSLLLTEIFHLSEEKVENKLIEADVLLFNSPIF